MDMRCLKEINKFCDNQKDIVAQIERDYMWRRFTESYFKQINKKKNEKGILQEDDVRTIINTLLDENTLESSLTSARKVLNNYENDIYKKLQKNMNKGSWIKNIGQSILANFIYSILLLIMFAVAKDQIASWLSSIYPAESVSVIQSESYNE